MESKVKLYSIKYDRPNTPINGWVKTSDLASQRMQIKGGKGVYHNAAFIDHIPEYAKYIPAKMIFLSCF